MIGALLGKLSGFLDAEPLGTPSVSLPALRGVLPPHRGRRVRREERRRQGSRATSSAPTSCWWASRAPRRPCSPPLNCGIKVAKRPPGAQRPAPRGAVTEVSQDRVVGLTIGIDQLCGDPPRAPAPARHAARHQLRPPRARPRGARLRPRSSASTRVARRRRDRPRHRGDRRHHRRGYEGAVARSTDRRCRADRRTPRLLSHAVARKPAIIPSATRSRRCQLARDVERQHQVAFRSRR